MLGTDRGGRRSDREDSFPAVPQWRHRMEIVGLLVTLILLVVLLRLIA